MTNAQQECDKCGKSFGSEGALDQHMEDYNHSKHTADTADEYVTLTLPGKWAVGLIAGLVAALSYVLPFFAPGIGNLWYVTVPAGIAVVAYFLPERRLKGMAIGAGSFAFIAFLLVPLVAGVLVGGGGTEPVQPQAGTETVVLSVPDMFCQGCSYSVQSALNGIPGVEQASVSLADREAVVVYDPETVTPEQIVQNGVIQGYGGSIKG